MIDPLAKLRAIQADRQQKHKQDVVYVQAEHPVLAKWLTEMTRAFGRCDYRVTMREV